MTHFTGYIAGVNDPRFSKAGSASQVFPTSQSFLFMKHPLSALRRFLMVAGTSLLLLSAVPVKAVPLLLNFQGRVTVDGTVFTGTGQFKFALVNADGSQSFWSNDGSSSAGAQPTAAVTVPVVNGNYSLHLGDTNMDALQASVFANDPIFLRIWFSDGILTPNVFEQLGSDHRITSVAFAIQAERAKVADTVPDNSITSDNLVQGLRDQLADLQAAIGVLEAEINNLPTPATGPTGAAGQAGAKGDKGDTGDTGPQGAKGDTGDNEMNK